MLTKQQESLLYRAEMHGDHWMTNKDQALLPGFHFCPEWDFMAICCDSPEWEACICEGYNGRVSVAKPDSDDGEGGASD